MDLHQFRARLGRTHLGILQSIIIRFWFGPGFFFKSFSHFFSMLISEKIFQIRAKLVTNANYITIRAYEIILWLPSKTHSFHGFDDVFLVNFYWFLPFYLHLSFFLLPCDFVFYSKAKLRWFEAMSETIKCCSWYLLLLMPLGIVVFEKNVS